MCHLENLHTEKQAGNQAGRKQRSVNLLSFQVQQKKVKFKLFGQNSNKSYLSWVAFKLDILGLMLFSFFVGSNASAHNHA